MQGIEPALARVHNRILLAAILLLGSSSGCGQAADAARTYPLRVVARTDLDEPLQGVRVSLDAALLGVTSDDGVVEAHARGVEGRRRAVNVECPRGFADAEFPPVIVLRNLSETTTLGQAAMQLRVVCHALERTVVVAVYSKPHLPIRLGDAILGHTNGYGVAHVEVRAPRHGLFTLSLDTTAQPGLGRPSPERVFELGRDTYFVWNEPLRQEKVARRAKVWAYELKPGAR